MTSSEDSEADDPCAVAIEPGTIDEMKPVCVEDGWPTAARISGMLLQQSVPACATILLHSLGGSSTVGDI